MKVNTSQIFGEKIGGLHYTVRNAVYGVIFNEVKDQVLVVKINNGHYFLPGGGIEKNEMPIECLKRELLEETGFHITVPSIIGRAINHFISLNNVPIINDALFFKVSLLNKVQAQLETDHHPEWVNIQDIDDIFVHDHQKWAVKEALKKID